MAKTIIAVLIALLPAAIVWWQARRLCRQLDSPTLAEQWWQLRVRVVQLVTAAVVLLCFLFDWTWSVLGLLPLIGAATLAAGFPARRAILGESWRLGAYLGWLLRVMVIFGGVWILLLFTPVMVAGLGPRNPWAIGSCAVALGAMLRLRTGGLVKILGAVPLQADEYSELQSLARELDGRSPARRPDLYRLDLNGGRWANAVVLVDRRSAAVVLSDQLFELLEPAEQLATYAHELAHLEYYTPERLRRNAIGMWFLVCLALAVVPLSSMVSGDTRPGIMLWLLLLFIITLGRGTLHQKNERVCDLRALELCGDAQAVVSGLTKIHLAARIPRRLDSIQERRLTHPSLARRIQAIRAAAAAQQGGEPGAVAAPPPDATITVAAIAGGGGRYLLLEGERMSWLDGVPSEAVGDPSAMRATARSTSSVPYRELSDLRLTRRSSGATLLIVSDLRHRRTTTVLNEADSAAVQAALDRADGQLGVAVPPSFLSHLAATSAFPRLTAVLLALTVVALPGGLVTAALAGMAAILPRAAWLIGTAVCALGGLLVAQLAPAPSFFLIEGSRSALQTIVLVEALLLLGFGLARAITAPEDRGRWAWLVPALLGGATCLMWAAFLLGAKLFADGAGLDLYRLHSWVSGSVVLLVLPMATAATILVAARLRLRWCAVIPLLTLPPALWIGGESFRSAHVRDPFIASGPPAEMGDQIRPELLWESPLPGSAFHFRLAADGQLLAFSSGRTAEGSEPVRWTILRNGDRVNKLSAVDIGFAADGSLVAIVSDGETWTLQQPGSDTGWSLVLPHLDNATLALEESSHRWAVNGHRETDFGQELLRLEGVIGGEQERSTRIELEDEYFRPGSVSWIGSAGVIRQDFFYPDEEDEISIWRAWFQGNRSHLQFIGAEGELEIPRSRVTVIECQSSPLGAASALCLANDDDRVHLWRLWAANPAEPAHIASLHARYATMNALSDRWVALGTLDHSILLDPNLGVAAPLDLSHEQHPAGVVALSDHVLAVTSHGIGRHKVAVYRIPG